MSSTRQMREQRVALEHHRRAALGGRQVGDVAASPRMMSPRGRDLVAGDHAQRRWSCRSRRGRAGRHSCRRGSAGRSHRRPPRRREALGHGGEFDRAARLGGLARGRAQGGGAVQVRGLRLAHRNGGARAASSMRAKPGPREAPPIAKSRRPVPIFLATCRKSRQPIAAAPAPRRPPRRPARPPPPPRRRRPRRPRRSSHRAGRPRRRRSTPRPPPGRRPAARCPGRNARPPPAPHRVPGSPRC